MIELQLSRIMVDETRNEQVIVFREKTGTRYLPVVIGMAEVNAIKLKLSGVNPPRPMTHDLLIQILAKLGVKLEKIIIDRLHDNTFYAKIYLTSAGKEAIVIDARPSDSVALAVRTGAPIFADEEVVEKAGIAEI
jgi:bifunctional DNase/RNase